MKIYKEGTKIIALKDMGARELKMSNDNITIHKGDTLTVIAIHEYGENVHFMLELENKFGDFDISAWNYADNKMVDDCFEIIESEQ